MCLVQNSRKVQWRWCWSHANMMQFVSSVGVLLLAISVPLQKPLKWCWSVKIIMLKKACKYNKLVFSTELNFCNNQKSNGKIPLTFFFLGKQEDANFWVIPTKMHHPIILQVSIHSNPSNSSGEILRYSSLGQSCNRSSSSMCSSNWSYQRTFSYRNRFCGRFYISS